MMNAADEEESNLERTAVDLVHILKPVIIANAAIVVILQLLNLPAWNNRIVLFVTLGLPWMLVCAGQMIASISRSLRTYQRSSIGSLFLLIYGVLMGLLTLSPIGMLLF